MGVGRRVLLLELAMMAACVPSGSNPGGPPDTGPPPQAPPRPPPAAALPALPVPTDPSLRGPFEDNFDRPASGSAAAIETGASLELGADWQATLPGTWRIEAGRLCGERAHNHGVWLKRMLPTNARIEFDAVSQSSEGDIKAEYWGDGRSYAAALSYTNATSYLTIFGGWHNKIHVLARLNEHGSDRKEIAVDPASDDPRQKPVVTGQVYHFKVERTDGKTLRWWVDGNEMLTYPDATPLVGPSHDHFGFNDWEAKVCFDSVRIVPLP